MSYKSKPVAIAATDTDIYTCPATLESAAVLGVGNTTGGSLNLTMKFYKASLGTTLTIFTAQPIAAGALIKLAIPFLMEAGDIVKMAGSSTGLTAFVSAPESSATPIAQGFVPKGAYSAVATYDINDMVDDGSGNSYVSRVAANLNHTPGSSPTQWAVLALRGLTGSGDMTAANNLSDLVNKKTARDNLFLHGADIASAGTINLETATGDLVDVTGTTAITAVTLNEGHERTVRFTGILTLTNGASLILPGAANIATAAGDVAIFRGYASGLVRCIAYTRASGKSVIFPAASDIDPQLFPNVPQNSQSAAYTTVAADAQKSIFHPAADTTARIWTIDSNANVPYPIGTMIMFDNDIGAGVITIAITADTLVLVGAVGSTGSRTLAAGGQAVARKVTSTRWRIGGTGLT